MALIDDLFMYLKLDETSGGAVYDSTANHNDGGINGATYTASGKINGAYNFDGSNDHIDIVNAASFNIAAANNKSFQVWFKTDNKTDDKHCFSHGNNTGTPLHDFYSISVSGSKIYFKAQKQTGSYVVLDLGAAATATWYHVVMVHTANRWDAYVNGNWVTGDADLTNHTDTTYWGLGGLATVGILGNYFDGVVDEVGFWNRNLSAAEVTQLYNSGNGLAYPFTTASNFKINISDVFKDASAVQINIGDTWKDVSSASINIGDAWKTIF